MLRSPRIVKTCETTSWAPEVRTCFKTHDEAPQLAECRTHLTRPQDQALAVALAAADHEWAAIVRLRKVPGTLDCKTAAAAYFTDAAWKRNAPSLAAKDRARVMVAARQRMAALCTKALWSATERACLVAGIGEPCFR